MGKNGERQNITVNLPRATLNAIKRLAAERETSMAKVISDALEELAKNDRQYATAKGDK